MHIALCDFCEFFTHTFIVELFLTTLLLDANVFVDAYISNKYDM